MNRMVLMKYKECDTYDEQMYFPGFITLIIVT
jgi:hypothetical protein